MPLPLARFELYVKQRPGFLEQYADAVFVRGLGDPTDLKSGPGRMVVLTRGRGPGLSLEGMIDSPIVTVRVVGKQNDYDDAEQFADWLDRAVLAGGNVNVGGVPALFVNRTGGGPTHITTDRGRRAHFSCSYIVPVASGLTPVAG